MTTAANDTQNPTEMVEKTLRLIDLGLKEFDQTNTGEVNSKSVIFVGDTGAGKSAIINLLAGRTFRAILKDTGEMKVDAINPLEKFKIGHSTFAETSIPRKLKIGDVMYWDCPGLEDNRSIAQEIANAVCIKRIFEVSNMVKVVLVATDGSIADPRALPLANFVTALGSLFSEDIDNIKNSVSLIATHVKRHKEPENIKSSIRNFISEQRENYQEVESLLESLIQRPISLFKAPEYRNYDIPAGETGELKNEIFANINGLSFASDVSARVTLSAKCKVTVNQVYKKLNEKIQTLMGRYNNELSESIDKLLRDDEFRKNKQKLEKVLKKLNKVIETPYSVQTIPEIANACQETAQECGNAIEEDILPLKGEIEKMQRLEDFVTEGIQSPIDIIQSIKEIALKSRGDIEKALINITCKEAEERAKKMEQQAEEAKKDAMRYKQIAEAEARKLEDLQKKNDKNINPGPSGSTRGKKGCIIM